MLLAIDIGNTSIHAGIFQKSRIIRTMLMQADASQLGISKAFKKNLSTDAKKIKSVVISSVVPEMTIIAQNAIKRLLNIQSVVLGADMIVPIANLYKRPKQVGQDRLVNAYACKEFYGCPAIVLDFGTATTFDYINRRGEYEGGIITPGVNTTIDSLSEKTALLPRINLGKPERLIGKDTVGSIKSGVFYGIASMCDGLICKIKKKYKNSPIVIATGGLATLFCPYCKEINKIDKYLTLKGIAKILQISKARP